jgi:hypothetical protein
MPCMRFDGGFKSIDVDYGNEYFGVDRFKVQNAATQLSPATFAGNYTYRRNIFKRCGPIFNFGIFFSTGLWACPSGVILY